MSLLLPAAAFVVVVLVADRILLHLEARGWINYRRRGLSRGGAVYHTLEIHAILDPAARPVMEAKYAQRQEEDESGAPPAGDDLEQQGGEP